MENKVSTILKENMALKEELHRLVTLVRENEAKYRGITLVEDAFLTAESLSAVDTKALAYIEEIFDIDRAVLFIDEEVYSFELSPLQELTRIKFTNAKTLRYAYVEKRPYFGAYIEGLISDFRAIDDIASYIIAPIVENGRITASLNLYSRNSERISNEAHADFIKGLTLRVWITLKNLHNIHLLKIQNRMDALTGLFNKSCLHNLLEERLAALKSTGEGFTFVLTDIDNFKAFNSERGHIEADGLLKEISERLKALVDKEGVLGRFGGDEFYFLLHQTEEADLQQIFSAASNAVRSASEQFGASLRISGGFARAPLDTEESAVELARLADGALKAAKAAGGVLVGAHNLKEAGEDSVMEEGE